MAMPQHHTEAAAPSDKATPATIEDLLDDMKEALDAGDLSAARNVLAALQTADSQQSAWQWLQRNKPKDYDELLEKLRLARDWYAGRGGRTGAYELSHLIQVFEWCRDHGIGKPQTKGRMGHYREAVTRLYGVISSNLSDNEKREELRRLIRRIRTDRTRADTRAWARGRW